jgi:hypothetical protein
LRANIDDSASGNSNIAAAEYFIDTVGADGSGTAMTTSDGAFDSATEAVTAAVDVSGWTIGSYTLYVHGKDAAGNWGATGSVVLDVTEAGTNILYVESIAFSSKHFRKFNNLYTTVKVVDGNNKPVEGARVEMTLTHEADSWNFAGNTESDGNVKFTLLKAPSGDYRATVTSVTCSGYDSWGGATEATCTLSDDGAVKQ